MEHGHVELVVARLHDRAVHFTAQTSHLLDSISGVEPVGHALGVLARCQPGHFSLDLLIVGGSDSILLSTHAIALLNSTLPSGVLSLIHLFFLFSLPCFFSQLFLYNTFCCKSYKALNSFMKVTDSSLQPLTL